MVCAIEIHPNGVKTRTVRGHKRHYRRIIICTAAASSFEGA